MSAVPMLAIGAVILVGFFDNFAQFPVVAPYARSLGAAPSTVGLIVAVYSTTNLAGNLLAGYMIDRLGRKRLLVMGLCLAGLAVLLYTVARTPAQLIYVRAFHGLAAAVLAPAAFTLLGDVSPPEWRGRAMGAGGTLIALAAMIAPAFSGVMRDRWGFGAVFTTIGALLLLAALFAQATIVESHRPRAAERPSAGVFGDVLARRSLTLAYLSALALTFGLGTLVTHLPLYLSDIGFRGTQTGLAFSAFAFAAMLVMAGPMSWRRGSRRRLAPAGWGLFLTGVAMLLLPFRLDLQAIIAAMAVYGVGFGLIFPSANAQVVDATSPNERGTAFGIFYAFYSVGVILGASTSGLIANRADALSPFHLGAAVAFPAAAIILLVGAKTAFVCNGTRR